MEKEGWRITHDPLILPFDDISYQIDLGAEGIVGAEREGERSNTQTIEEWRN